MTMNTQHDLIAVVTGGAGFIGSHIADAILARGYAVRILDDFSTGRRENIAHLRGRVEVIEGSVLDGRALASAFAGADCVFHQAAIPSVPKSIRDPLASHEANATGTLKVLLAARAASVRRTVIAGSSAYYGDTPTLPKREDMPPAPLSPYGLQKYMAESYALLFHKLFGLETVVLRYFNVFGPRQDPDSEYSAVIPKFIRLYKRNEAPMIYGDGSTTRDFTFVSDVIDANLLAATAPGVAGEVFNIAGGRQISLNDIARLIKTITNASVEPTYQPSREGDIMHSFADISKAEHMLGYRSAVGLEEGLRKTVDSIL